MTRDRKSVVAKTTTSALKLKEADDFGTAVQAAIRAGEGSSQVHVFLLFDVTPLSVRLETALRVTTYACRSTRLGTTVDTIIPC